ncbi:MAG: hypothetical protein EBQ92_08235 [Proteobacteria bacterium]|nr:hypothetical protein [Pseudomonadota bacterium]
MKIFSLDPPQFNWGGKLQRICRTCLNQENKNQIMKMFFSLSCSHCGRAQLSQVPDFLFFFSV